MKKNENTCVRSGKTPAANRLKEGCFMTNETIQKVQAWLAEDAAALVISPENRYWLTGYFSTDGTVLVTKQKAYFFIDFRYIEKAREVVPFCEIILAERGGVDAADYCKKLGIKTVFAETDRLNVADFKGWQAKLGDTLKETDDLDRFFKENRAVKSSRELDAIRRAQVLTDETFSYICERIEAGRTEREVMLDMEFYIRKLGSEGASFEFIVVSGKNSSLPHGVPTDKKIEKGDFLTMDFGGIVDGYHSDMTRTVAVGTATDEMKKVYETVYAAQEAAFAAIRPGVDCFDVDKAARDLINGAGYEGCFGHGLGHGVGVEIHEAPNFNTACHTLLRPGMVMTVEPGIYLENKFGVRIEDMVFVTENGFENITKSPKNLIIL